MTRQFVPISLLLLTACSEPAPDLAKLNRAQRIQRLRTLIAQNPNDKTLQQQLGETALEEGDAQTAIDAFRATGDTKGESVARFWMDSANFATPPGTAQELLAAATSVRHARMYCPS
jgi:predicted Zn-dependent protease